MNSPYRQTPPVEEIPSYSKGRWYRRFKRKLRIFLAGRFKKRLPYKCPVCNKPANIPNLGGDEIQFDYVYEPCGHKHGLFDMLYKHGTY